MIIARLEENGGDCVVGEALSLATNSRLAITPDAIELGLY